MEQWHKRDTHPKLRDVILVKENELMLSNYTLRIGNLAETMGFEPTKRFHVYSLSRGCCVIKQAPFECSRHPKNTGLSANITICARTSVSSHTTDTLWWTLESLALSVSDSYVPKGVKENHND